MNLVSKNNRVPLAIASALTNTVISSAGNVNPDDVLRHARALHLGDTIN